MRNTIIKIALNELKNKDPNNDILSDTNGRVSKTRHLDWSQIYSIFDNDEFPTITLDHLA